MPQTAVQIGPADHGRRMSLADFEFAEGKEGHLYELSRGVVTVVDVPNFRHMAQFKEIRRQFAAYELAHPERVYFVAGGMECKILVTDLESERHPDLSVYKHPPEEAEDWSTWVPEIVIEIVSHSSRHRDYEEKPEEYFRFGVREYWIVDEERQEMLVHRRVGGRWVPRVVAAGDEYRTRQLPGFALARVFAAARAVGG